MRRHPLEARPAEPAILWRADRLRKAGMSGPLADAVAADCAYDVHAILELIDRGCPPGLAVRIVAPIEWEPWPC